jgi:hypothetical protein
MTGTPAWSAVMNQEVSADETQRNLAVGCHLLGFLGLVLPLGNILGPLVLWLLKREGNPFVDDQGREAVNFQITVTLAALVSAALMMVLIGFVLLFALAVYWLVVTIVAALHASRGEAYRYPLTLRLIS